MHTHQVLRLLVASLFSVSLTSAFGIAYAADPNAVEQLRQSKKCNRCDLTKANLSEADLSGAYLLVTVLSQANWYKANLSGANLDSADLSGVTLNRVNLSGASLYFANLSGASLFRVDLSGAELLGANLSDVGFEPTKVPPGASFIAVKGLDTLRWGWTPTGMILLRKAFQEAGMRHQEREVTYAQLKRQRIITGGLEGTLQYILFEATSDWGMSPARPFWIMLGLIPLFALIYTLPIARPSPKTAVWRIWEKDRARKDQGQDAPEQLTVHGYRVPLYALFFSVLSAFQIGWRELNVGSWISRLNPYEFTLKGTGWVRTVSGIQSLISVYLLALAVLTYFGRPFE